MSIRVVNSIAEKDWREFIEANQSGNIFHTPEMFQVFDRTKGYHQQLWAAVDSGRVQALMLPVEITLMNGLLRPFTTRSVVFGGALWAHGEEGEEALSELLRIYTMKGSGATLFTELRNLYSVEAVQRVLGASGFKYEDHLNYLIDINRYPEAILQSIGRKTRKHIRRGLRRSDVVIEEVRDRSKIALCYDLLKRTYKKAELPIADRTLFEAALEVLLPKNMVRFTLAYVNKTAVAVSVDLLHKKTIYGWYGGVDREYAAYMPNEILTWKILEWGAQNGYHVYDFGGAGKPDEKYGVRDFKAKFGGELVCFGRNTFVHSPKRLWLSKQGYQLLRKWL